MNDQAMSRQMMLAQALRGGGRQAGVPQAPMQVGAPPETAEELAADDAQRATTKEEVEQAERQRLLVSILTGELQAQQQADSQAGQRFRQSRAGSYKLSLDPADMMDPGKLGY